MQTFRATSSLLTSALRRDMGNVFRFGSNAPLWCQRIWVDPRLVTRHLAGFSEASSAQAVSGEWDLMAVPLLAHHKVRSAYEHWHEGLSWQQTGVIERYLEDIEIYGSRDGCRSLEDVEVRLAGLDNLYDSLRTAGKLKTRREIQGFRAFRERGGVRVHIARDGEPVFGGSGYHRLAISRILGFGRIPAQIGVIHPEAIRSWKQEYSLESDPGAARDSQVPKGEDHPEGQQYPETGQGLP